MNLTTASRIFQLFTRILDVRTPTEPFLPTVVEKPELPLEDVQQPFPRVSPESQGVSSRQLQSFFDELRKAPTLFTHDVMVLRNGKVLCEGDYARLV